MSDSPEAKRSRDSAYTRVTSILGKLRKAGSLDWDTVLDLTRDLDQWQTFRSLRWAGVAATAGSPPECSPACRIDPWTRHGLRPRHRHRSKVGGGRPLKVGGGRPCRWYSAAIARRARLAWVQGWAAPTSPKLVERGLVAGVRSPRRSVLCVTRIRVCHLLTQVTHPPRGERFGGVLRVSARFGGDTGDTGDTPRVVRIAHGTTDFIDHRACGRPPCWTALPSLPLCAKRSAGAKPRGRPGLLHSPHLLKVGGGSPASRTRRRAGPARPAPRRRSHTVPPSSSPGWHRTHFSKSEPVNSSVMSTP
jgi:hypothetical protein